jgi:hypothetical protein
MTAIRRFLPFMTLSLGCMGVVVCIVGIIGTWLVGSRLNRATENVFAQIDSALVVVRGKVVAAEQRVRAAKIDSEDIEQSLKNWTKEEVGDRLTLRLGIEEKTERLASSLQQADHWLEFSESSLQLVQQALELANATGAPIETKPVETKPADRLLEELASLRAHLMEATGLLERIRERTAEAGEEKSLKEKIDQAVQLALRVIATLSSVDSRLGDFGNRLSETQTKAKNLKIKTQRWIRVAMIGITLLILWMAAGQISLCLRGWQTSEHMQR